MTSAQQTLRKIQSLEQLYRRGYHSDMIDTTIEQLIAREQTQAKQALARLAVTLHEFEERYQFSSEDFYRQFQAGELGDEADFFEWSAFYQMWLATQEQINLLNAAGG
ncbi:hypothetical protein [Candidatus Chloroploca sp. Khr17]|uniref:hypothetical protein n=1 Tax=Candidatus Chloroploca sp. Khr17 TaxID=2496869 RepID=UPI00101DA83F|nr:hypothetical protein [Candidatus Chloroploca sp. Khr17]